MKTILLWLMLAATVQAQPILSGLLSVANTAAAGGGSITYVRGEGAQSSDGSSVSASFGATPTAGNTVIVAVGVYDEVLIDGDVTDNQGNTYTNVAQFTNAGQVSTAFYICNNVSASGTFTITCSPGAATYPAIAISEWSNVNNGAVTTDTSGATGTGTAVSAGVLTSPTSGYVLGIMTHSDGTSPTLTAEGTYTLKYEAETSSGNGMPISFIVKSSSTDETPAWTAGSSVVWACSAIAIQP